MVSQGHVIIREYGKARSHDLEGQMGNKQHGFSDAIIFSFRIVILTSALNYSTVHCKDYLYLIQYHKSVNYFG